VLYREDFSKNAPLGSGFTAQASGARHGAAFFCPAMELSAMQVSAKNCFRFCDLVHN
jgi:hypothetical protein